MTFDELNKIVNKSPKGNDPFDLDEVSKIQNKVPLMLEMDRDSQTYYYSINDEAINNSFLNEKEIMNMVKRGWRINNDKKIFYKII